MFYCSILRLCIDYRFNFEKWFLKKNLGKVITPDTWKVDARKTTEGGRDQTPTRRASVPCAMSRYGHQNQNARVIGTFDPGSFQRCVPRRKFPPHVKYVVDANLFWLESPILMRAKRATSRNNVEGEVSPQGWETLGRERP